METLSTPEPTDWADFDAKLDALAGVITTEQPDLVGVQEIGDEGAFEQLCARLGPAWTGALSTTSSPRTPSASAGCHPGR